VILIGCTEPRLQWRHPFRARTILAVAMSKLLQDVTTIACSTAAG
jgi:hypothetical protein